MNEGIETKKDQNISMLVIAIERLATTQDERNKQVDRAMDNINKKMDIIAESMGKQEVILEKLSNIEKFNNDANKRVHRRIDATEANIEKIFMTHQTGSSYAQNMKHNREIELVRYEEIIKDRTSRIVNLEQAIEDIKDIPNKILWKFVMAGVGLIGASFAAKFLIQKLIIKM